MKEFNFNYFTAKNSVSMDDFVIRTKTGLIKKEFPISNLEHYFIFYNTTYQSVFFIYTDDKGKRKKIQVFATPAEMAFTEMANELKARFPDKGLNHLSDAEAFKAMKVANPNKWAPFAAFFIMLFVMCGILYPQLRHYFDFGFEDATVADVGEKKDFGTRNINITGHLLDKSVEESTTTTSHGSTTKTTSVYIPMVDENWKDGDPIKVVLSFDELSDDEYSALLGQSEFTGVIRNVAWEGIGNKQLSFLENHYSLKFTEKPVLVEITNEKHNDTWVVFVLGLTVVILIVVFVIVAVRRNR